MRLKKNICSTLPKHRPKKFCSVMQKLNKVMQLAVTEPDPLQKSLFTEKLDAVLLHRRWGYLILLTVLFLLFQSVFLLAQYPMDWVELGFGALSGWLSSVLSLLLIF